VVNCVRVVVFSGDSSGIYGVSVQHVELRQIEGGGELTTTTTDIRLLICLGYG